MTPVFCCGGECGVLGPHFSAGFGSPTFATGIKNSAARSIRCNVTTNYCYVTSAALTSSQVWVFRFYVYFTTLPSSDVLIAFTPNGFMGLGFKQSDGKLYSAYNATGLHFGATGYSITTGVWYRVDCLLNNSVNPTTADVTVNGTALTQVSYAGGTKSDTAISLGNAGNTTTMDVYYDDIVVSNTSGDYPIGAGYVNHFIPTSDGTHNITAGGGVQFARGTTSTEILNSTTDSYLLVDEVPMDGTTPTADDFINCAAPAASTDYSENKFGPASGISTPTTGPRAVECVVEYHEAGTGLGGSAIKLNDNGTEDAIVTLSNVAGVTTGRYTTKQYATMVGGGAWTSARFNNLRVRFGYSSDANPDQYFDCAMIEAEFAPLAVTAPIAWTGA